MNVFVILGIFAFTVSTAPLENDDNDRIGGKNGWYIPQFNSTPIWVTIEEGEQLLADLEKQETLNKSNTIDERLTTCPVHYYIYTKSNENKAKQITATSNSILKSMFDATNPTRFIIHGWIQNYKCDTNELIRDAWLSQGDYNIIAVNWDRARSIDYISSVVAVPKVGKKVAKMIDYLVKNHGMSLNDTIMIGHSLGAHVAGYVGKNLQTGQLRTIAGLDPALPLYHYSKPNKRLNSNDAQYVESIQTNGGKLGFLKPIGKGTFYPNGGKRQPGCGKDLTGLCSHSRSCIYYAEAVQSNNFPSMHCGYYEDAVKKSCGSQYNGVKMGAIYNYELVAGEYYVPVHSSAPFGYGC